MSGDITRRIQEAADRAKAEAAAKLLVQDATPKEPVLAPAPAAAALSTPVASQTSDQSSGAAGDDPAPKGALSAAPPVLSSAPSPVPSAALAEALPSAPRDGRSLRSKGPRVQLNARISPDAKAQLVDYCARNGCSMQDALEQAINLLEQS